MGYAVIKTGILKCSHPGLVPFTTGSPLLTVNGIDVVVSGMEMGISIKTCPFINSGGSASPCTSTNAATSGVSTKLRVAGQGVLLSNAGGTTVNTPPATWGIANAGQSILLEN